MIGMHNRILSIFIFAGFVLASLPLMPTSALADEHARSPIVIELFTSQGCATCVPADDVLADLAKRPDVLALSFHVDYWDYIGWKDPFADREMTARQYSYLESLSQNYAYTPQIVINGVAHELGSNSEAVAEAIERAVEGPRPQLNIELHQEDDGSVTVSVPAAPFRGEAVVWLVQYDRKLTTEVTEGENRGRTLTNYHVVRDIRRIATWNGSALDLTLDPSLLSVHARDSCAIIVQANGNGPIIGARALDLHGSS